MGARKQSPNDEKKWACTPPTTRAFQLSVLKTGGVRDSYSINIFFENQCRVAFCFVKMFVFKTFKNSDQK